MSHPGLHESGAQAFGAGHGEILRREARMDGAGARTPARLCLYYGLMQ